MEKEVLKRIFEFLEEKEEHKAPFIWKHINDIPLTKEELNIKGNLNFFGLPITSLPKGLKVSGSLNLMNSYVESLPEGLEVGGALTLAGLNITSLPEELKVGGDLYLGNSKIQSLPKGLKVLGWLYIPDTKLTKYTDKELREMIYPGFIKGEIRK